MKIQLKQPSYAGKVGDVLDLPSSRAVALVQRGLADLIPSPAVESKSKKEAKTALKPVNTEEGADEGHDGSET